MIDRFAASGQCEFVHDYAWSLAAQVIADLLGVDQAQLEEFKRWSDAWVRPLLQPLTEDEMIYCMGQIAELQHYLVGELDARRAAPRDDLMSDIARATFDLGQGEVPLRKHEQLGMCEVLIVAGNDTTANALSLGMLRLVECPGWLIESVVISRRSNGSRKSHCATRARCRIISARSPRTPSWVDCAWGRVLWCCGPRPPRIATRRLGPGRCLRHRPRLGPLHLAFGGGIHTCAGASLARQELVESYDQLLRRLGNFRLQEGLTPNDIRRMGGLVTHGLARLPIRFDVRD